MLMSWTLSSRWSITLFLCDLGIIESVGHIFNNVLHIL